MSHPLCLGPIPAHLASIPEYAPHQAWLRDKGEIHHDPGEAKPEVAVIKDRSFVRSSFVGSRFDGSRFVDSSFDGSRFDGSSFVRSRFDGSRFDGSSFVDSRFDGSSFVDSRFDGSSFVDSSFDGSRFVDSSFDGSRFVRSSFVRSSFDGSRFDGSRFVRSRFDGSRFDGSRFDGSRFVRSSFVRSSFDKETVDWFIKNFAVPSIPDLDNQLLTILKIKENSLDMGSVHECDTTHCRAGWYCTFAAEGKRLETALGWWLAGVLLYRAAHPDREDIPNFFASDEGAMESITESAALECQVK